MKKTLNELIRIPRMGNNIELDNVEIIKNFSKHASFSFKNKSLDFVYIDGEHIYNAVVEDIQHWVPKIKPGGYIAGHDYWYNDVVGAVKDALNPTNICSFKDSSWLVKI